MNYSDSKEHSIKKKKIHLSVFWSMSLSKIPVILFNYGLCWGRAQSSIYDRFPHLTSQTVLSYIYSVQMHLQSSIKFNKNVCIAHLYTICTVYMMCMSGYFYCWFGMTVMSEIRIKYLYKNVRNTVYSTIRKFWG